MSKSYTQVLIPDLFKHPENISIITLALVIMGIFLLPKDVREDPDVQPYIIGIGSFTLVYALYIYWLIRCLYSGKPCVTMGRLHMIIPLAVMGGLLGGVYELSQTRFKNVQLPDAPKQP